jgi:hypothetical protein
MTLLSLIAEQEAYRISNYVDGPRVNSVVRESIIAILEGEIERMMSQKKKEAFYIKFHLDQQISYYQTVVDNLKKK